MLTLSEAIGDLERALVAEKAWRVQHDYALNRFWGGGNQETMHEVLIAGNSPEDVIARVLSTGLYTHHAFEDRVDESIDWHLRVYPGLGLQINLLPPTVQESPLFPSAQSRQRELRRMSPDFFRHCYVAWLAGKMLSWDHRPRVLELGAGCGKVAVLLRRIAGSSTYFICDIPESLVFARLYLGCEDPEAKTLWIRSPGDLARPDMASFDYVFVPTMYSSGLTPDTFDIFMNFHSLGEFDNRATRFWMRWLQGRARPQRLLVCNRYLNFIIPDQHGWRLRENEASVSFDHRWKPILWELEPKYLRCPYIHTMQSRYLLFAAFDGPEKDESARCTESAAALSSALATNYLRNLDDSAPLSFRWQLLANDLSMEGPLYQLWNAVRIDECVRTLYHLVRYLDTICPPGNRVVEERAYYLARLEAALDREPPAACLEIRKWLAEKTVAAEYGSRQIRLLLSHRDYNLVQVGAAIIAVRQDLGPVDFSKERLGDRDLSPYILRAEKDGASREEAIASLRRRIDSLK